MIRVFNYYTIIYIKFHQITKEINNMGMYLYAIITKNINIYFIDRNENSKL